MKIKPILSITLAVLTLSFFACDDDINPIGGSIQPGGDLIDFGVDTFDITAKTILWDSIYARTTDEGLLGEYDDPIFGKIKSDYLCEFYCTPETDFHVNYEKTDSMFIRVVISGYVGDSLSPMGLSVYKINRELERNFYTNIDPTKYCDMTNVMGRNVFTLSGVNANIISMTPLKIKVPNSVGESFYQKWREDPSIFHTPDSLKAFLPGIYVTQTLGKGAVIDVNRTELAIHYTYKGRNHDDTTDSTRVSAFLLSSTPEVIQMNRVQNTNIDNLLVEGNPKRTYFKTPAGAYTELTIPLSEMAKVVKKDTIVNSASIRLKGFTEEEQYSAFARPTQMLFINKDSINDFFRLKNLPDNTTSFIINRSANTNTYDFSNIVQYNNIVQGFIPKMINHYLKEFRNGKHTSVPDLKYVLIPVTTSTIAVSSGYGTYTYTLSSVSNLMKPTSAIIRTDEDNMKMPITFSKYKDR